MNQIFKYHFNTCSRASMQLINCAVLEGWIRQLAFYHLLKARFNNGCIYSYKSRMDEIAKSFSISTKTLYNYLNFLRSKELIYDHANNIKLKSIRDFKAGRKKCIILINRDHNLFDVTCLLYCKLIEQKARQQAFMESVRRFGRGDRFNSRPCENPFLPSLSYRTIAKVINVSEYKAFNIVRNLNRLGVIGSQKQKPQLITKYFTNLHSVEDLPGYRFNIGDILYEQYGNRIEFNQFPVFLRKITIRQYNKFINNDL